LRAEKERQHRCEGYRDGDATDGERHHAAARERENPDAVRREREAHVDVRVHARGGGEGIDDPPDNAGSPTAFSNAIELSSTKNTSCAYMRASWLNHT
jgi:hypothetical protein